MRYTFDVVAPSENPAVIGVRLYTTTNEKEVKLQEGNVVHIYDNLHKEAFIVCRNQDEFEEWLDARARSIWKENHKKWDPMESLLDEHTPPLKPSVDHINPSHYQDYCNGMQWLEAMQYLPAFKDKPEIFKGALQLQIRKYLDRNGRKDEELRELKKGLWYFKFLVAFVQNGERPIRVEDVERLLSSDD